LKFRVEELDGMPLPIFEEVEPRKSLLMLFVTSVPNYFPELICALKLVEAGTREYCSFSNECIEVRIYKNRVVIEDHTVLDRGKRPQIELQIVEAIQLVVEFLQALIRWQAQQIC